MTLLNSHFLYTNIGKEYFLQDFYCYNFSFGQNIVIKIIK